MQSAKVKSHEYTFEPEGAVLQRYLDDDSRISLIMGPLGSGKTFASCWKVFQKMCNQRAASDGVRYSRFYAIRNTYPDLTTTTIKDWLAMFRGLGKFKAGGTEPPTHYLKFKLPDGTRVNAEMVFMALDNADSIKKLRGSQVTGFWLNEVKELNKAVIDMADLRHGRYPSSEHGGPSWHGMIGDTNAPDEDHWYYKLAEETKPEGWSFHRQPAGVLSTGIGPDGKKLWFENPQAENLSNLPDGYYQKGLQGKSDDWISVNLGNNYGFVVDGKPIFPEYNDGFHCREISYDKFLPLYVGIDFGLTPAAGILQKSVMGQIRIIDELVCKDMGAKQFGGLLYEWLQERYPDASIGGITCDPAGDQRDQGDSDSSAIAQLNSSLRGMTARPASTNVFTMRREALATPMTRLIDGQAGFVVSPRAKMIRKGLMGGYNYKRLKVAGDERYQDAPNKNEYSHPVEGAEYGALGMGMAKELLKRHTPATVVVQVADNDYDMWD